MFIEINKDNSIQARYYNPGAGRFLSEDPIGFESGDYNEYRYVKNKSMNFYDLSGLQLSGFFNDVIAPSLGQSLLCFINEDLCSCMEGDTIGCQGNLNPIIEHTCNLSFQSCPLPNDTIIIHDESQDPGSC